MSDRELIRAYRTGNERAFETLLNRYQAGVFTKIQFIVRDAEIANDLFQDTWIKVVQILKTGKYVEEGKFAQCHLSELGWVQLQLLTTGLPRRVHRLGEAQQRGKVTTFPS